MTERRPHWDDDLVNAVIDLQYHCVDCMEDDYPEIDPINHDAVNAAWAHEIIATVEDWHKAKRDSRDRTHSAECWRWHQECAGHLIERQRSTIQRVLAKPYLNARPHGQPDPWREGYNQALREVRDTLMDRSHE